MKGECCRLHRDILHVDRKEFFILCSHSILKLESRYRDHATGWTVRGSNRGRDKYRSERLCKPSNFIFSGYHGYFLGVKLPVRDAHHWHPTPRLWMRGAIPPHPLYALVEWTGINLPFVQIEWIVCHLSRVFIHISAGIWTETREFNVTLFKPTQFTLNWAQTSSKNS